jgi:hypothetical protein
MNVDKEIIEKVASKAHNMWKFFTELVSDEKVPGWELAEDWQRDSAISNVKAVIMGTDSDPKAEHERWCKEKMDAGWAYGPVKDGVLKTHPCLVDFDKLPACKQGLDSILHWTIKSALEQEGISLP